jgi:methylmalonyl-CoA mutase
VEHSNDHILAIQTLENWKTAANKELEGTNSIENLIIERRGIVIKPYYTAEDTLSAQVAPLPASGNPYGTPRDWANMPKITVFNAKQANEQALFHLQNGADGICFEITTEVEPEQLLTDIELPYCLILFLVSKKHVLFLSSFQTLAERKYKKAEIRGTIFWKGTMDLSLTRKFVGWSLFQPCGIIITAHHNVAEEVANAIALGVEHIEKEKENGVSAEAAFQQTAFSISVGNDFFIDTAKIKALRICWQNIEKAYRIQNHKPVFIHALSSAWIHEGYQPHGNLIKETYAALAAILGGCNGLTLEPEDQSSFTTHRIARNTSSILREESFLSRVADPLPNKLLRRLGENF